MKSFKKFLYESSGKNLHLEHLEDEILNDGIEVGQLLPANFGTWGSPVGSGFELP